ncbi:MAG: hypothetical protein Q8R20_03195 [Nanoarchaeota archaeon]|nr:hypothetical protein [Nanoarchaeota archaeon]
MENPFCISRKGLRDLLGLSRRNFVRNLFYKCLEKFSREEIEKQLNTQTGELMDAINTESELSVRKTENAEVITALQLSDFYFPDDETEICFAMRRNVDTNNVKSYEGLVSGFENATHIDCLIKLANKGISFQIKRYPERHLPHTNEAFVDWFKNVLSHYGNMKGTILSVTLQPAEPFNKNSFNFSELAISLSEMREIITFDEVALVYNDANEYVVLHKIFPKHKRLLVPLYWALKRFRGEV